LISKNSGGCKYTWILNQVQDDGALVILAFIYMGIQNTQKKWTMPVRNWGLTISQLAIFFEGRLNKALKL
jgi:hypothetical protein